MKYLSLLLAIVMLMCAPPAPAAAAPKQQTPLTPGELYTRISPAIPQILTDYGSGSGILIERRGAKYVVTNQHVLWPFHQADIVFPDGQTYEEVPLIDWDVMVDVAVLGPIETDLEPARFNRRPNVATGDPIYLLGYPAEWEPNAQPTLASGLVSRLRAWDLGDMDYIQVDAEIAGGQSGGALLAADGAVIGMTTYHVAGTGSFAMALAIQDVVRRVDGIVRGADVDELGPRFGVLDDADDILELPLDHYAYGAIDYEGDSDLFVLTLEEGQEVYLWIESMGFDPTLLIGPVDAGSGEMIGEEYRTADYFGLVAEVYYEAPADGDYVVLIDDLVDLHVGGYIFGADTYDDMADGDGTLQREQATSDHPRLHPRGRIVEAGHHMARRH